MYDTDLTLVKALRDRADYLVRTCQQETDDIKLLRAAADRLILRNSELEQRKK